MLTMLLHKLISSIGGVLSRNKLNVLIYHQVVESKDPMRPSEPDVKEFEQQMAIVARHYNVLPLSAAVKLLKENRLPKNALCITFDDGYINNLTVALPVLRKFDLPATVFVATAFVDGDNMWNDRLLDLFGNTQLSTIDLSPLDKPELALGDFDNRRNLAYELIPQIKYQPFEKRITLLDELYKSNNVDEAERKMMSVEQIKELRDAGVEIGAHTHDHPILSSHDENVQFTQIEKSKTLLEKWLDESVDSFAYPNGKCGTDYTDQSVEAVKRAGFQCAVSY